MKIWKWIIEAVVMVVIFTLLLVAFECKSISSHGFTLLIFIASQIFAFYIAAVREDIL